MKSLSQWLALFLLVSYNPPCRVSYMSGGIMENLEIAKLKRKKSCQVISDIHCL